MLTSKLSINSVTKWQGQRMSRIGGLEKLFDHANLHGHIPGAEVPFCTKMVEVRHCMQCMNCTRHTAWKLELCTFRRSSRSITPAHASPFNNLRSCSKVLQCIVSHSGSLGVSSSLEAPLRNTWIAFVGHIDMIVSIFQRRVGCGASDGRAMRKCWMRRTCLKAFMLSESLVEDRTQD
eukprot:4895624-Amphidinium_carterae.2